ncbi:MAG TPA: sortase [Chloroflexota bacterium]|jgi:LPXTG-site transpeptidase (sortase) family protein
MLGRAYRYSAGRLRGVGRPLGWALLGAGGLLVVGTALVATGILPLWQPSVPPPPALVEARATSVTRAPDRSPSPTPAAPSAASPAFAVAPTPVAVFGAPPDWTPVALRFPQAAAPARADAAAVAPDALAAAPRPTAAAAPTIELSPLPTLPPPPTLITSVISTPTPRPTAVPPPPPPGLPVHLVIPSIQVDTKVVELSTALDAQGAPQWETVPFVAGHYRMTGLVGARTNVVLSGHVVTRDMGNVFRDLHLLRPGDPVVVSTDEGQFTYVVSELRLVDPADTSVLAPSSTPRLSLITCAGQFDFRTRTFNQRLVVIGDLATG